MLLVTTVPVFAQEVHMNKSGEVVTRGELVTDLEPLLNKIEGEPFQYAKKQELVPLRLLIDELRLELETLHDSRVQSEDEVESLDQRLHHVRRPGL